MCSSSSSIRSTSLPSHLPISSPRSTSSLSYINLPPKPNGPFKNRRSLVIRAIDAVQPCDYEAKIDNHFEKSSKLKIAIVGFGNYGQFMAKTLVRQGHTVLATNRTDNSNVAKEMGVRYFSDAHDLFEEQPEVILVSTAIVAAEEVVTALPHQRLKGETLFVDVLSVKEFPKKLLLSVLPQEFDVLCTHPMFGPQSGKNGWENRKFVYEKVRIGNEESRKSRCDKFLNIFAQEGCEMVEMSCAEHDKLAAESQW